MPRRLDYVATHSCCLGGGSADDVHEIIGGTAHRMRALVEPCCWLPVSRARHGELQYIPKVKQLALKLLCDPANFDLQKVHEVWGRPSTAISAAEVLEAARQILIGELVT